MGGGGIGANHRKSSPNATDTHTHTHTHTGSLEAATNKKGVGKRGWGESIRRKESEEERKSERKEVRKKKKKIRLPRDAFHPPIHPLPPPAPPYKPLPPVRLIQLGGSLRVGPLFFFVHHLFSFFFANRFERSKIKKINEKKQLKPPGHRWGNPRPPPFHSIRSN